MNNDLSKKYYSIGEIGELLGLPTSTLRYWESRFPELRPRRSHGGQRRYSPEDVERVRMVAFLVKEQGLHIDAAVQRLRVAPDGVSRRAAAINRLHDIRNTLAALLATLNSRR